MINFKLIFYGICISDWDPVKMIIYKHSSKEEYMIGSQEPYEKEVIDNCIYSKQEVINRLKSYLDIKNYVDINIEDFNDIKRRIMILLKEKFGVDLWK